MMFSCLENIHWQVELLQVLLIVSCSEMLMSHCLGPGPFGSFRCSTAGLSFLLSAEALCKAVPSCLALSCAHALWNYRRLGSWFLALRNFSHTAWDLLFLQSLRCRLAEICWGGGTLLAVSSATLQRMGSACSVRLWLLKVCKACGLNHLPC